MENLICNHCKKEVSASSLAIVDQRYANYALAEDMMKEKPQTIAEIKEALGVSTLTARKICYAVGRKTKINQKGKSCRYVFSPK